MSYVAQRAVLDTRTRIRGWTGSVSSLLTASALVGLAALLALRWWEQNAAVPLSWQSPPVEALFLLPAAPVLGLLALRLVVAGRARTVAGQHLMQWTARWAAAWAVATAVGLVLSVQRLYGVPLVELWGVDNLITVAASSDSVRTQLTLLWISLLIALFADRLGGWRETLGALVLTATALVAGMPAGAAAHAHTGEAHPAILVVAAVQLVAVAAWLGALAAVAHLRTPPYLLMHHLTRFGGLVTAAAVALGGAVVLGRVLLPGQDMPVLIAIAQLAGIALVAAVGYRHRARTVERVASGRALLLLGLVAGEVVVLIAMVMLGGVLPVAG